MSNISQSIELLAAEIGEQVYIDVAKWHLYLADAKLNVLLAEKLYPIVESRNIQESAVVAILATIPIKLGGGKREVPLSELLPGPSQATLIDLLEESARKL